MIVYCYCYYYYCYYFYHSLFALLSSLLRSCNRTSVSIGTGVAIRRVDKTCFHFRFKHRLRSINRIYTTCVCIYSNIYIEYIQHIYGILI